MIFLGFNPPSDIDKCKRRRNIPRRTNRSGERITTTRCHDDDKTAKACRLGLLVSANPACQLPISDQPYLSPSIYPFLSGTLSAVSVSAYVSAFKVDLDVCIGCMGRYDICRFLVSIYGVDIWCRYMVPISVLSSGIYKRLTVIINYDGEAY